MEGIQRLSHRLSPLQLADRCSTLSRTPPFCTSAPVIRSQYIPIVKPELSPSKSATKVHFIKKNRGLNSSSAGPARARAGWFLGIGEKKKRTDMPEIVKAGDPVLHEPAREVPHEEIGSDRIQKIIDDMVKVMRAAPGVGLAAPQIGIPLKVGVLSSLFSEHILKLFNFNNPLMINS